MAGKKNPGGSRVPELPGSEVTLSEMDARNLFPRAVRPFVFKLLWAVLVVLLVVLVFLALHYHRSLG